MEIPSVSPGEIVSDPRTPAFRNSGPKPNAGTTAVARVTASSTVTTNASPCLCTDPAKISDLFGPDRGKLHAVRDVATSKKHATRVALENLMVTAGSPRPETLPDYYFS
jgi:hypothetical protein